MGRRLDGWRKLSWHERGRLAICVPLLWTIHAMLAIAGYKRTRRAVEALTRRSLVHPASPADLAAARQLARLAAIAGRYCLGDATCLRRALLLQGWLRQWGLDPRLHLGVKPAKGLLAAHAWVELDGIRLLTSDAEYRPFAAP